MFTKASLAISMNLFPSYRDMDDVCVCSPQSQRMKQGTVLAPVIDLKRGGSADDRQIIDTPPHIAAGLKVRAVCVSVTQLSIRV
jgi:splicing factor 45